MNEEKKEEEKKEGAAQVADKPAAEEKAPAKAETEKKEPEKQKRERPKNCSKCNKPIKRKTWYFRNGKYFCGKGCWKLSQKKAEAA